jgi:hypothetical protein
MDLFNNPMIESAKKSMSPEQLAEYKRIGEYMYNNDVYKVSEIGSKVKEPEKADLILYATESLKSGGSPHDLSQVELRALIDIYGDKWYERFDLEEDDVPKPVIQMVTEEEAKKATAQQSKKLNMSRNQRRMIMRKIEKEKRKSGK